MGDELPLFPLRTVLFPGGRLDLRIFERRYLDLVTHCVRNEAPFGICLIEEDSETGLPARPHAVGTAVRIIDWDQRSDGLLGITVEGQRRFEILERHAPAGTVQQARVRWLAEQPTPRLDAELQPLADLLERILDQIGGLYGAMPRQLDDAGWVSARLSELLPIPTEAKQQLLEIDAPEERLELLRQALEQE
ncbi:LON peptidase substrate-binding domain-containing protein [Halorhodospira halophila]|uniref:Peptidase S16, lon domain protein n=1 Tax=Halorhodospira halophila (strain DSM 244 / SL1) TaxID=349124 RepID=A1WYL1_HALHL|nr:LON peptidase substrate-binding domain-containing protein [Halorhodospira halophila]ABM62773.1 peptidase S16, lon domain protein [Halorhodospira halophila SL1]MBK1728104.1 peptidase S16 [Halorhodospira halophila]